MIKHFRGRALAFVVLTAILSSISGLAAYHLRPLAKAVAVIAVSDGELEELIPELIPAFAYTPPAANDVAVWLDNNTAGSAHTLIAEDNELAVMVWDKETSQAVLRAQQLADSAISFFDTYRRDLMQDIYRWFDVENAKWDSVLAARLPSDEQELLDIFETALITAEAEACSQTAASCRSVADDLGKLRAASPTSKNDFVSAEAMRSNLVGQKVKLMVSEAWNQPVARLASPAVTVERPAWARLPVLLSGGLVLSTLAAGLLISLYNLFAGPWRGLAAKDEDGDQIFSDPHWPARVPEMALIGRTTASADL